MASKLPLILVAGMGADERFFEAQVREFPNAVTASWLQPKSRESLGDYARRLAAAVDPGGTSFLCGCSFGGMLALEMTRWLDVRACLLISSVRSPGELPRRYRLLRPVAGIATQPLRLFPPAARLALSLTGRFTGLDLRSRLEQLADTRGRFLRWTAWAVLTWRPADGPRVPVVHLHGSDDPVLPCRLTHPDVVIPGGGHVLPVSHAREVNAFLRSQMDRYSGGDAQIAN